MQYSVSGFIQRMHNETDLFSRQRKGFLFSKNPRTIK
jgi:hypothetical protein